MESQSPLLKKLTLDMKLKRDNARRIFFLSTIVFLSWGRYFYLGTVYKISTKEINGHGLLHS